MPTAESTPHTPACTSTAPEAEPLLQAFVAALTAIHGDSLAAILLYGSFLRGKRDTVLDFYVLLDSYAALPNATQRIFNRLLPPNVYHLRLTHAGTEVAAKYATVTLTQFERAIARDFHSYFWARFAQPAAVVHARDRAIVERLAHARECAVQRLLAATVPMMPTSFTTRELWVRAFTLTYGCELRAEGASAAGHLYAQAGDELQQLTQAAAQALGLSATTTHGWHHTARARRRTGWAWRVRTLQGKFLSVARLFKAAFTFNEPLDYIVWKIARHSGVVIDPTPLQRRHPLLFSWGLLWRLYRKGGFR